MNNKSTSHLVTVLPLQKHQTLVGKHLRYQRKENSPLQELLPRREGALTPQMSQPIFLPGSGH